MPSANYVWPQLLNKYARKVIEANGGEVVFEEYYPLDQAEYSATIGKIRDGKVDCVFNTVIPPGLQPFVKQLYESGFQKNGGVLTCVYYDENLLNYHPAQEMEGLYSCLDYFQSVDDPFSKQLQADYMKKFPDTKYLFTAGSAATGMYRGIKFYEAAVKATNGDLSREAVSAAMDKAKIDQGPGGGAEMVPGKMHCKMNMYIAQCKVDAGKTHYEVDRKRQDGRSQGMLSAARSTPDAAPRATRTEGQAGRSRPFRRVLPWVEGAALARGAGRPARAGRADRSRHACHQRADPVAARASASTCAGACRAS